MMPAELVNLDIRDGILAITLKRPAKKNALNLEMYQCLNEALQAARTDDEIRVVLLQGNENCFTSGNDLFDFEDRNPDEKSAGILMLEQLATFEKPVVAAVAGVAIGIGVTLLLHCDLVYASPETRFRLPFVPLAIVPEGASTLLLPLMAGHQRASKLLLLGDFFNTKEACETGIVSEVVPLQELFSHARTAAEKLAGFPQTALLETKRLIKSHLQPRVLGAIEAERQIFNKLLETKESRAARKAARNSGE